MQYYIVEKFERLDDEIVYTVLGYVTSLEDRNTINEGDYNLLQNWLTENELNRKTQTVNLSNCIYLPCYGSRSSTSKCPDHLPLISDINDPEGIYGY